MRSSDASGAAPWRNWAGNVSARPVRVTTPGTAQEVAALVLRAAEDGLTVRMTGTGHSFTPAAVTDGVLLRPDRLTAIRSVDAAAGLVTVEAGCPLYRLNRELRRHGLGLANMGDVSSQTVAGAIQTGTHGTGRDLGSLAAQVAGLELVLADGRIVTCSAESSSGGVADGLFDAARVSVGALGVVTAVTLRVVPAFLLTAREEAMRWSEVLSRLDEFTAENEHFEFFWFPHSEGCMVKRNNRSDGPASPLPRWRYLLDDEFLSNTVFGLTCRLGNRLPALIPAVNGVAARALGTRVYTDYADRVFTSPRRVRFKEQEYAIPRGALPDALSEIRGLLRRRDWRISFPVEVRVTPPEETWLSMSYGRDTAYIATHVYYATAHQPYFTEVEQILTAAGGRPHWGKMHTRDAHYLAGAYPRFDEFVALRETLDPHRRFGNSYLSHIFGR